MAKIMISLPDDLLARVDAQATQHRTSRSATIRQLVELAMGERRRRLGQRVRSLEGGARRHGGKVVEQLEASRPA